jgi:azurin
MPERRHSSIRHLSFVRGVLLWRPSIPPLSLPMSASHTSSSTGSGFWSIFNAMLGYGIGGFTLLAVLAFMSKGVRSLQPKPQDEAPAAAAAAPAASAAPAAAASTAAAPAPAAAGVLEVKIMPDGADPTGMKYDVKSIEVKVGQTIKLTFENKHPTLPQPHNVCIGKLGSKASIVQVAMAAATMPDAMAKGFVPETPDIIAHTKLLQPGQSETIEFKLDAAGEYPYICTFPGHGLLMNGVINVK